MNAMQKIAYWEVAISFLAFIVVAALYPMMGHRATGAFGILGLLGFAPMFLIRKHKDEIISDERDKDIEQRATYLGVGAAWMFLFLSLIVITLWHGYLKQDIPVKYTVTLIWIQFALCYGVKGAVSLTMYRVSNNAA